jgi:hypothetical protein
LQFVLLPLYSKQFFLAVPSIFGGLKVSIKATDFQKQSFFDFDFQPTSEYFQSSFAEKLGHTIPPTWLECVWGPMQDHQRHHLFSFQIAKIRESAARISLKKTPQRMGLLKLWPPPF